MWIKICANTNLEDAQLAAQLGADAVGFVFAPSARQVTPEVVARITPHLPPHMERVGVFTAINVEEIARVAQHSGLTVVQLHGTVTFPLVEQLYRLLGGRVGIIQTVHWQVNGGLDSTTEFAQRLREIADGGLVDRVLIDSKVGEATGGTGVPFDWNTARSVLEDAASGLKLIIAGGLRAENVATAIQELKPWGVDVAGGVEVEPGKKNPERLAAFISKARAHAS
jgi:phosphoribosylanthranilate isomerase